MSKRSFIRTGKKVLASAVSAAMVVAFTPVVAWADDGVAVVNGTTYTSLESAISAISSAETANVTLLQSIDIPTGYKLTVSSGHTVNLDLNGYTITEEGSGDRQIINSGSLNIWDSSQNKTGTIQNEQSGTCTENGSYGLILNNSGAKLTISSGNFLDVSRSDGSSIKNSGTLEISGGTFTGTGDDSDNPSNTYDYSSNARIVSTGSLTITGGSFTSEKACYTPAIKVAGGTATISNASFSTYKSGCFEAAGGELTLENVIASVSDANSYYANAVAVSEGGTVTIKSGTYTGYQYGVYIYNTGGTASIEAGTFEVGGEGSAVLKADMSTQYYDSSTKSATNTPTNEDWALGDSTINVSGGTFTGPFSISSSKSPKSGFKCSLNISGGTFNQDLTSEANAKYVAEHCSVVNNNNGTWTVTKDPEVAQVGSTQYYTLTEAVAASNGKTITLLHDTNENIVVPAETATTLDLNGFTLSGGTVSGTAAITNHGNLKIVDKSASGAGQVIREDNGTSGYYVIDNQGKMEIASGKVYNCTGTMPDGSSLIRNAGKSSEATLTISGGEIKQDGFIAVKNDDHGKLSITGGAITATGKTDTHTASAVQNWGAAEITGGTINGALWASVWSNDLPNSTLTVSEDVKFSGDIVIKKYSSSVNTIPVVTIAGGDFSIDEWKVADDGSTLTITGGAFSKNPTAYVPASGYQVHKDGSVYHVHATVASTVSGASSATCTSAGYTGDTVCPACNAVIEKGSTIAALGHAYGAYVTTTAPTETSTGVATSTCSRCGATQTTTLAKLEPAGSDTTATGADGSKVDVVINTNPSGTGSSAVNGTVTYNGPAEGSTATSVSIPAIVTIGGSTYDVTSIAEDAFAGNSTVTSVTIPSTVKTIGESAFENCTSLASATLPAGVTTVAASTFAGCTNLGTLEIKGSVTAIGDSAFEGCSALTTISVPVTVAKIGESAFKGCSSLTTITVPAGVTEIAPSTFEGCANLGTIELKGSVATIGESAFMGCGSLSSIDIPSTVTAIGESAFANSGLATVTLPAGVTAIAASTFAGCSSLAYATMQGSITEIGEKAFEGCTALKTIAIPSSVRAIGASAFEGCSSLNSVSIPGGSGSTISTMATGSSTSGVTVVGARAFANSGVTAVSIGKNVSLGTGVFRDCAKLKTATVKAATLPTYAFKGCTALKSVSLAKGVTTIQRSAFSGCKKLTGVVLPSSVTSIAKYAFYGASKVKTLTVNSKSLTKSSVKNALKGSSVTTVKCPKKVVTAYKKLFTKANCGKSAITVKAI